ncbi:NXPE family member 3-like isoform X2 [Branchiostoma floridae x Branchiostoma japonicum]
MINKFKCVVTVAMGTSVFLFFGLANKQFWQLRSYRPFHAPAPLSRDLFSDGFGDKTIPDAREGARLHRILQEFTGSYLDIPADKETATSADFTEFQILHPGSVYRVGDILSVMILAKDMRNREKTQGGDFFRAKIYTERTKSSAPGRVRDFGNGTYGVRFRLLWEGDVTIGVRMVHSSSAVRVIKRLRENFPTNRTKFRRRYVSGNRTSDGWCSSYRHDLRSPEGGGICDFSDRYASLEWYCERPWNVTCNQSVYHGFAGFRTFEELVVTKEERLYFKPGRDLRPINADIKFKKGENSTISVLGRQDGYRTEQLPRCTPGLPAPVPSGYYRNGQWVSRVCQGPRLSSALDWKKCLQNSSLDLLGDSTTRQWYYFLKKYMQMKGKKSPYLLSQTAGPLYANEEEWNITSRYQSHGPPINTFAWVNASVLSNLVRIIDEIDGPNHVVVVTVGFHFNSQPLVDYVTRIRTVRAAILRLLDRQPDTSVVIKPPNTAGSHILNVDDWPSFQMYLILKEMFTGLPVVFVDAWEMTDCQFGKDTTHPSDDVVREEMLYMLSYICK